MAIGVLFLAEKLFIIFARDYAMKNRKKVSNE
jgi:hypothetical protein